MLLDIYALIREDFPGFAADVSTVLHIRRAGDISGQQLGQFMLETIRAAGGRVVRARVTAIEGVEPFSLRLEAASGENVLRASKVVNAAGPFAGEVAAMLGEPLQLECLFQQEESRSRIGTAQSRETCRSRST